jgi:hypothetical protein
MGVNREFIQREFDLMKDEACEWDLILPFEQEILALSDKMGEQGHSGMSASMAIPALCNAIKKLLLFEPIVPITNISDRDGYNEWVDCGEGNVRFAQSKRCSGLFMQEDGLFTYHGLTKREVYQNGKVPDYKGTYHGSMYFWDKPYQIICELLVDSTKPFLPKHYIVNSAGFEVNRETKVFEPGSAWWISFIIEDESYKELESLGILHIIPLKEEEEVLEIEKFKADLKARDINFDNIFKNK